MGRIRTIKPEFFQHEGLYDAERETGLPLRLAYAGLWTCADREGRFPWQPRKLKANILPYDDIDFSRVLDALGTRGFVVRYASQYGYIPTFTRHQVINNRERASELPNPVDHPVTPIETETPTRAPRVDDACPTPLSLAQAEGKGKEQGRERNKEGNKEGKEMPRKRRAAVSVVSPETWLTPYLDAWKAQGGEIEAGRLAKALRSTHDAVADPPRLAYGLSKWLLSDNARFGPEAFARDWRRWVPNGTGPKPDPTDLAFAEWLAAHPETAHAQ